jgi:hypothetical protein
MIDGVAHACLRGEVDDASGRWVFHQVVEDARRFDAFGYGAKAVRLQKPDWRRSLRATS